MRSPMSRSGMARSPPASRCAISGSRSAPGEKADSDTNRPGRGRLDAARIGRVPAERERGELRGRRGPREDEHDCRHGEVADRYEAGEVEQRVGEGEPELVTE